MLSSKYRFLFELLNSEGKVLTIIEVLLLFLHSLHRFWEFYLPLWEECNWRIVTRYPDWKVWLCTYFNNIHKRSCCYLHIFTALALSETKAASTTKERPALKGSKQNRVSTPVGKAGNAGKWAFFRICLEKLENHRVFFCFGWKSWNLFLSLIVINSVIGWKMILSRNRIEEEKIVQCHMGQVSYHQVDPELEVLPMFCQGWLVDPCTPGVVYWKTLKLYRKFQFIGKFNVTQCFLTIVGQRFQWLEFHIKIHSMAGKQRTISAQKTGKRPLFLKLWLEFQL